MVARPRPDRPEDEIWMLLERIDRTELTAMLRSASVHDGQTRFVGNESLIVEGSQKVSGWLIVTGTLRGTGTLEWLGTMNLSGAQNITGPATFTGQLTVNGPWKFVGAGEITGNAALTGDLNVKAGGRIVVEGANAITLEQSAGTAHILMGGSEIRGGSGGVGIYPADGVSIITTAAGVRMFGLPTIQSAAANDAVPGTIWQDGIGYLYRVV